MPGAYYVPVRQWFRRPAHFAFTFQEEFKGQDLAGPLNAVFSSLSGVRAPSEQPDLGEIKIHASHSH